MHFYFTWKGCIKSEYNISQLARHPPSCNCSCSCLWGSSEWLRANTLQYQGGVTKEAEQQWSRKGKGPLPCILLCESQEEAAAICTPRCFLYVICNVKLAAAGVIQAFFPPVVIQRELPLFESSSACSWQHSGAREALLKLRVRWSVLLLLLSFTRAVPCTACDALLVAGETQLIAAHKTLLL